VSKLSYRFKTLPVSTKRLLSVGLIFALVVALPLFLWAIITQRFDWRNRADVTLPGECDSCNPTVNPPVNCAEGLVCHYGTDAMPGSSGICVIEDALNNVVSKCPVKCQESCGADNPCESGLICYAESCPAGQTCDIRRQHCVNEQCPGDSDCTCDIENFSFCGRACQPEGDPNQCPGSSCILDKSDNTYKCGNLNCADPFMRGCENPEACPPKELSSLITLQFKFAGVNGAEADGAPIEAYATNNQNLINSSEFSMKTASKSTAGSKTGYYIKPVVKHIGNGVYETKFYLTQGGNGYVIYIKGPKHLTRKICVDKQTSACNPGQAFSFVLGTNYTIDLTGRKLEPGDVDNNNIVNGDDFSKIFTYLGKLCSGQTAEDKNVADVNFDGCIDVADAVLTTVTLSTKEGEN
jgi:hypothetical protein